MSTTPRRTGMAPRIVGTILILIACLVVLINHPYAFSIAVVSGLIGVGLRIEAAITAAHFPGEVPAGSTGGSR